MQFVYRMNHPNAVIACCAVGCTHSPIVLPQNVPSVLGGVAAADLGHLAPTFVAHGVTSVAQLVAATSTSQDLGVAKWQVEAILASTVKDETAPEPGRTDLPVAYSGRRANFGLAVAAGQPNSRKRSLDALDDDILARSTNPAHEARLRTYISLCVVWEVPPWPLTYEKLKDGFPALGLSRIPVGDVNTGFILDSVEHSRDMAVLATWFMLREIEMAAARASHLRVDSHEVFILIPTYKTDSFGKLTERSLKCTCRIRRHPMCPYHAAVRHLDRLNHRGPSEAPHTEPLFPDKDGTTPDGRSDSNGDRSHRPSA